VNTIDRGEINGLVTILFKFTDNGVKSHRKTFNSDIQYIQLTQTKGTAITVLAKIINIQSYNNICHKFNNKIYYINNSSISIKIYIAQHFFLLASEPVLHVCTILYNYLQFILR
jgi:hypothetical protein